MVAKVVATPPPSQPRDRSDLPTTARRTPSAVQVDENPGWGQQIGVSVNADRVEIDYWEDPATAK